MLNNPPTGKGAKADQRYGLEGPVYALAMRHWDICPIQRSL